MVFKMKEKFTHTANPEVIKDFDKLESIDGLSRSGRIELLMRKAVKDNKGVE